METSKAGDIPLSAAVVMYKGADDTRKCLYSMAEHTKGKNMQLFLVDNASPDNELQKLLNEGIPPEVQVIALEQNKGFGAGHNSVIPLLNSKYHAVVNPDIILYDDAVSRISEWMEQHPDVVIATPRLVFPDGRPQHIAKRKPSLFALAARQTGFKFLEKYETRYLMLDEDLSVPRDVEFCSGCFFVIRTDVFKKMGGFDEKYFMYVEDADITQKALKYGRAVYLPQVVVAHAWQRAAHKNPKQFLWQLRSMFRYFRKWGFKLK